MPSTRPRNSDREAALSIITDAFGRIAKASIAGESSIALSLGGDQLVRIHEYIGRTRVDELQLEQICAAQGLDPAIVHLPLGPHPQAPNAPRRPRSAALRLVELIASPERQKIISITPQERFDVDYVPRFLCCTSLPASRVVAPPLLWAAWARLYHAPGFPPAEEAAPRIHRGTIDRWILWAGKAGIPVPLENCYSRESGPYKLEMTWSPTFGAPYGIPPRRIIKAIATNVTQRKKSGQDTRNIVLGKSYTNGIKKLLDAKHVNGRAFHRYKQQFLALINAHILWWPNKQLREEFVRYDFVSHIQRGLPLPSKFKKHTLWEVTEDGMVMVLGELFHQDLLDYNVPIDDAVFDLLAADGNCLNSDLYTWLTFRARQLKYERRIAMRPLSWQKLRIQFGGEYQDPAKFRKRMLAGMRRVEALYPKMSFVEYSPARGSALEGGLSITLKDTSVSGAFAGYGPGRRLATGTEGAPSPQPNTQGVLFS